MSKIRILSCIQGDDKINGIRNGFRATEKRYRIFPRAKTTRVGWKTWRVWKIIITQLHNVQRSYRKWHATFRHYYDANNWSKRIVIDRNWTLRTYRVKVITSRKISIYSKIFSSDDIFYFANSKTNQITMRLRNIRFTILYTRYYRELR